MKIYISSSDNPAINLATEEILLKEENQNIAFFYINRPSVIIGKHQNAVAEVNAPLAYKEGLTVFRRISGGGAVYHDPGNLNFCFIYTAESGKQIDFKRNSKPVFDFLSSLGLTVEYAGSSNLVYCGLKFSGNAEHIYKNRVLHHGTLLFSSDLAMLQRILTPRKAHYRHQAVESKPWPVMNLSDVLPEITSIQQFLSCFVAYLEQHYRGNVVDFSEQRMANIHSLASEKFDTVEWNYAYNAQYTIEKTVEFENELFPVVFVVNKGIITEVKSELPLPPVFRLLVGVSHHPRAIIDFMLQEPYFSGWSLEKREEFMFQLF